MANREIKQILNSAVVKMTPEIDKERVLGGYGFKKLQRGKGWKIFGFLMASFMIVLAGVLIVNNNSLAKITIDVNPSIELTVNKNNKIKSAKALNDDARVILGDMDLKSTDLNVGVNALVGAMLRNGYIDDMKNSILVSVTDKDDKKASQLQKELLNEIDEILSSMKLDGSVITQQVDNDNETQTLMDKYGITAGKVKLIQTVMKKNVMYQFDDLAKLSINELNLLNQSKASASGSEQTTNIKTSGKASDKAYIGKDKAYSNALNHAGLNKANCTLTESELDYDDGQMVYEIDFYCSNREYDYEIGALSGKVVSYESEVNNNNSSNNNGSSANQNGTGNSSSNQMNIGSSKALNIALDHAGITKSEAINLEVDYDSDDHRYEIDFKYNGLEYEYEINATNGKIVEFSKERD